MILGFIGAKLVIHALHTNELPFVNGGEHVDRGPRHLAPVLALAFIAATLAVTTVASLAAARRRRHPGRLMDAPGVGPRGSGIWSRSRRSSASPPCCSSTS